MRKSHFNVLLILITIAFTSKISAQEITYVCPPCGCTEDNNSFHEAGSCPACGMALVDKSTVKDERKRVAILIFNGVQIIDYTAPYEIFGQARFNVFTVAEKAEAIKTAMGMSVNPAYDFEDHPKPDILLVPGGGVDGVVNSPRSIKWIQDNAEEAEYVLSVCNGALILAKAGLLEGISATTFYGLLDELKRMAPNTEVVNDKRFVDNGKIITSAGLSAGIDASLHLVSKILGKGRAQNLALHIEYRWQPEVEFARANFADYKYLRRLRSLENELEATLLHTAGSEDRWQVVWQIETETSLTKLFEMVNAKLTEGKWTRLDGGKSNGHSKSLWTFKGEYDEQWRGAASLQAVKGKKNMFELSIEIARGGN